MRMLDDRDGSVRSMAVQYFMQLGVDDAETRQAVMRMLDDDEKEVRARVISYWIEADLGSERVEDVLKAFQQVFGYTSPDDDRKLSKQIGKLAAVDNTLLATILEKFSSMRSIGIDLALASAAAERDRLRREATPLAFSSP